MGKVKMKFDSDFEKILGDMAVKAVKEQTGNHCIGCGKELDIDPSTLPDNQVPCCAECAPRFS